MIRTKETLNWTLKSISAGFSRRLRAVRRTPANKVSLET